MVQEKNKRDVTTDWSSLAACDLLVVVGDLDAQPIEQHRRVQRARAASARDQQRPRWLD